MVTVSTSKAATRTYHHGDLRAALVEAGLKALETTDFADLSLRHLAREVGVSATAVYRHFPDKQALMQALANAGIEQLGRFQQQAAADSDGSADAFAATGRAYVRWALANPALFRLTFSQCDRAGQTLFGDNLAAQLLRQKAAGATGGDPEAEQRLMIQAWAVVHGLAMLMLDQQLPNDDAMIDRVIDSATLFPR
ncbi:MULTISPECIES: TetR/AcrR family transcriptional regulator [unclassified Novosphingobium]|uniref:TetR/AcrR family transcriptional regulator n=1 Tax=unclassified Novosphingobium TaxID=2644732 RepID=UPI0025D5461E|nr:MULTISPECIES: TetR/AcrR family transcriptional regulator [unclassified Novosphingobium]HQV04853.1 TetR/AcrR family transcriptional regulator [Novosphingobium sp.]